jgi:hypothetical protein
MLSFRQVGTVVWTFLAFMVAASLVLNLRYKPIGEGEASYLDTWTGTIHAVEATRSARTRPQSPDRTIEVIKLESLYRQAAERSACRGVRFAFPAEGSDRR